MAQTHVFFVVSVGPGAGLTSVCLGLVRALDREGLRVRFVKPIRQPGDVEGPERSTHFARLATGFAAPEPRPYAEVDALLAAGDVGRVLEGVVAAHQSVAADADVVVVEGVVATAHHPGLAALNAEMARALDAEVVFVGSPGKGGVAAFAERLSAAARPYGGVAHESVLGVIVNRLNEPIGEVVGGTRSEMRLPEEQLDAQRLRERIPALAVGDLELVGAVPWKQAMVSLRVVDVARQLGATPLFAGQMATRRVVDVAMVARTVRNMTHRLRPDALIVTPGDRDDVLLAACMAALAGVPLAGIVLTGGLEPEPAVLKLCERAFATGLPLLRVDADSYVTSARAARLDLEVPIDDVERIETVMDAVASELDVAYLRRRVATDREPRLSPAAFMHRLVREARASHARIVLPEGEEPRTVKAASECHARGIATCVLLGRREEVARVAEAQGVTLPDDVVVIEPTVERRERYVERMVALRRAKGMTEPIAREALQSTVVLGTMMLEAGEVDGLVSGAVHTTADTVRPALQFIKAREGAKLISSVFFMCLPEQVVVFGDCAINPDPDAEELADIAVQSAASAEAFGVTPRVAMLSFSTGTSGVGSDVDKVREATRIARERRPDLVIDGPLQYDAATVESVARRKAPESPVAGRATVLVFPDLNTGNTTYKAVQRSANVIAVGPMLQGLRRPVNDLSRGASVDDIVYTIALTAIQAAQARAHDDAAAVASAADASAR
ncbi:MAG: phosphate acetyltransferase [Trueperaceae bacterium]|nr:phosphate acetyltransferase [Trueperaceae bacterium]